MVKKTPYKDPFFPNSLLTNQDSLSAEHVQLWFMGFKNVKDTQILPIMQHNIKNIDWRGSAVVEK